jgi:hypothetical protein
VFAFARPAPASHHAHRRPLARLWLVLLVAGLAVALSAVSAVRPAPALALSTFATRCDGVTLRSRPTTSSTALASLSSGIKVVAVDKVSGGSWRTTCAGTTTTGSSWYKITVANGKDVSSRFGVSAVYGASSLFQRLSSDAPTASTDGRSVRVSSIRGLLATLADNTVGEIVVANGRYHVSPASSRASDSIWIGARYANRTRAVTVRAETRGGVTFDGGGNTRFGCITFAEGAHHQTWSGFRCANGAAISTGVVTIGGYAGKAAPHHITMRNITIAASCTGRSRTASDGTWDHAFYISYAVGGPHDLLFDNVTVDGRGGLASAFHFYHSDSTNRNAWNVTVKRLHVTGTQQAIILWDPTLRNIRFDGADITNALSHAVRHEAKGASGIMYANITSTGSGVRGFYSSMGSKPSGVTFSSNSFR